MRALWRWLFGTYESRVVVPSAEAPPVYINGMSPKMDPTASEMSRAFMAMGSELQQQVAEEKQVSMIERVEKNSVRALPPEIIDTPQGESAKAMRKRREKAKEIMNSRRTGAVVKTDPGTTLPPPNLGNPPKRPEFQVDTNMALATGLTPVDTRSINVRFGDRVVGITDEGDRYDAVVVQAGSGGTLIRLDLDRGPW